MSSQDVVDFVKERLQIEEKRNKLSIICEEVSQYYVNCSFTIFPLKQLGFFIFIHIFMHIVPVDYIYSSSNYGMKHSYLIKLKSVYII